MDVLDCLMKLWVSSLVVNGRISPINAVYLMTCAMGMEIVEIKQKGKE